MDRFTPRLKRSDRVAGLALDVEPLLQEQDRDRSDQTEQRRDQHHRFGPFPVRQRAGVDRGPHALGTEVGDEEPSDPAGKELRSRVGHARNAHVGALHAGRRHRADVRLKLGTPDHLADGEDHDLGEDHGLVRAVEIGPENARHPLRWNGEQQDRPSPDDHANGQHPVDVELLDQGREQDQASHDDRRVDGVESTDRRLRPQDPQVVLGVQDEDHDEGEVGGDGQQEECTDLAEGRVGLDPADDVAELDLGTRRGLRLRLLGDISPLDELRELVFVLEEQEDDQPGDPDHRCHEEHDVGVAAGAAEDFELLRRRLVGERAAHGVDDHEQHTADLHEEIPRVEADRLGARIREALRARHDHRRGHAIAERDHDVEDDDQHLARHGRPEEQRRGSNADDADPHDAHRVQRHLAVAVLVEHRPHQDHDDGSAGQERGQDEAGTLIAEPRILAHVNGAEGRDGEVRQGPEQVESLDGPELPGELQQRAELPEVRLDVSRDRIHGSPHTIRNWLRYAAFAPTLGHYRRPSFA